MGNSFIGFPVPRAKIADMIEGAAPPLEHHTNHESGGPDEMNVTDLVGAGGGGGLFRGLWIDDYNADATAWHKTLTGSSALNRSYDTLALKTDDAGAAIGTLYRKITQSIPILTWEKKRHLLFQCYLDCDDRPTAEMQIHTGRREGSNYMGFSVENGTLVSENRNATLGTYHLLKTFTGAFIGEDIRLEAILFPGEKIEFWVNGVLEWTETSRIPSGTTDAEYITHLRVDNDGNAYNVEMDFSHIQVYQEA